MTVVVPLTSPDAGPPKALASLRGSHSVVNELRSELVALTSMYFPSRNVTRPGSLVPPLVFQNCLFPLNHSFLPICSSRNEPFPGLVIVPVQPRGPMVRFRTNVWPESVTGPATWTEEADLRSAWALAAIWSAVSPASGLPDGCAEPGAPDVEV